MLDGSDLQGRCQLRSHAMQVMSGRQRMIMALHCTAQ